MPATVKLPDAPKEKEFEEFLSAYFHSAGLYVERNIIDRQDEEVLEIDLITTDYNADNLPIAKLYEVKSGKWGFNEIFKLAGWLGYLKLDNATLVVAQDRENIDFYNKIASNVNVKVDVIDNNANALAVLQELESIKISMPEFASHWRFSYWIERQLLKMLTNKKKSCADKKAYKSLDWYISLVNNRVFFEGNVIERAKRLYEAYKAHPNISARLGTELSGGDFNLPNDKVPNEEFKKAFYSGEYHDLHISCYVEYRARLAILKSAIDYQILKESGSPEAGACEELLALLPTSFVEGLQKLSTHSHYYRYPIFWQYFLWVFGGIILEDYTESEYEMLSRATGVPITEVGNALLAFDILFESSGGWFKKVPNTNIKSLTMFPLPFCGLGAHLRRNWYGKGEIGKMALTGQYTAVELSKWVNLTIELLRRTI